MHLFEGGGPFLDLVLVRPLLLFDRPVQNILHQRIIFEFLLVQNRVGSGKLNPQGIASDVNDFDKSLEM